MSVWGVDYASVDQNAAPNWTMFQRAGGSMVWIRASYAYYDQSHRAWSLAHDSAFTRDWAAVPKGITKGAYFFPVMSASQTAEEQVAAFAAAVKAGGGLEVGIDFPPCIDVEFPQGIAGTGLDRAGCLAWLKRAVAAMRSTFGCWPFIYCSGRVWNDDDTDTLGDPPAPDLVSCPLWLARYQLATRLHAVLPPSFPPPTVPTPWGDEWHAHQGQGDAVGVPGLTSTADVDEWRGARPRATPADTWRGRSASSRSSPTASSGPGPQPRSPSSSRRSAPALRSRSTRRRSPRSRGTERKPPCHR